MGAAYVQRLAQAAGNRSIARMAGEVANARGQHIAQRVAVNKDMGGETIYENPKAVAAPTAAQKQFVATSYLLRAKYEMTRAASDVDVVVKIQFVDQARGTNQWKLDAKGNPLLDKSGNPVPDPDYQRDVGKISEITDKDRKDFAIARCDSITKSWDHYDLVSKELPKGGLAGLLGGPPKKDPIRLKLNFKAVPVFDPAAKDVHTTIRLFGMGTVANRSGAHPIDAGHWYMDTKTNYAGMDEDAIAAHEYGHLLGIADEYSRSNDQIHQAMHRMGGGAKNSDKELDNHTVRRMTALALWFPVSTQMNANIVKVAENIASAKAVLQGQLAGALRKTWLDASVRKAMEAQIAPALKSEALKRQLPEVIRFESSDNFSNLTLAKGAMGAFTTDLIKSHVIGELQAWPQRIMGETFKVKDDAGTESTISAQFSNNVWAAGSTGAGAAPGAAIAQKAIGAVGLPVVKASPTLIDDLQALPAHWKRPANGIGNAYTAAVVTPQIKAAVDTAIALGVLPKVKSAAGLYMSVYKLVETAAQKSALDAVGKFVSEGVRPKVRAQMDALQKAIDNEVDAIMGMGAKGVAAKSADPNIKALASQLHTMLTSQQNKKSWDQAGDINPGTGSAGMDVKYTMSSMMGTNDRSKGGFRADMINPVVSQFNNNLKKAWEDTFKAEVKR